MLIMERLCVVILLIILLSSGLAVIYAKYNSRLVFIEIQKAEQELDRLEVLWGRLTLEERMLAEHNRVEKIARKTMGLVELERKSIVYIKL
ncbi:cell division protein FtsL, putative [methanotrophic endosymbiont of Bathymodiolus azoricus (Menez Gwen)]|jgi:cell division protein FtsL|nr:cell division protein FtsL, putative [methanotrophic endosymbiont of Bathymodiolus azoricus (Menez Gwen)]